MLRPALRREQLRDIEALGWSCQGRTRGGHVILERNSDGRRYMVPSTPGDGRSWTNTLADLRRMNAGRR